MKIFLVILSYFLILGISIFLIIKMSILIKKVRLCKQNIDKIEAETYLNLRELQIKSKDATKLANKINKQKKSILADLIDNILIMLIPFKKIKAVLLLNKFVRNIKPGFTFAELMISLTVISVLAAVLYPNLMHFIPNSNKPLFKAAYKTLANALAEVTTEKTDGFLQTTTVGGVTSGQQLCRDFCSKANTVPEDANSDCVNLCADNIIRTTNGMRWLFENHASYPVLESRAAATNKSAFRITVDVNPSNSDLTSTPAASICTFVGNLNSSGTGVFCYRNNVIYDTLPNAANVNGVFNLENAKSQDTFQFLVDEKGKIISISPVGWAILEDNSQLD